ncbi:MAG: glycosyltransferase [Bacteroidales bacterium]|nr:glycosyltransferase [Bacteroidales bacterium]
MKILVILSRIPWPLEKGDKLRAYHQLRCLSKNNEIVLFALNDNRNINEAEAKRQLLPYCSSIRFCNLRKINILWNIVKAFFRGKPLQVGYFYSCRAKKALQQLIAETNPDRVFCQLVRTAEYGKNLPMPTTIDYQDTLSQGIFRREQKAFFLLKPFFKLEYKRLQRYEDKVFEWFDHKTIISKPDRDCLTHPRKEEVTIIPNGVDHQYFTPSVKEKRYDLIFNGNMSYPPNINASKLLAKKILPIVHQTLPDTTLLLSGAQPHEQVKALQSEKITVSGWVDDIRENYAMSRVFIAPMQIGTGLQNKLLEAMSMKLPCITSDLANASLGAEPGTEILTGNTPETFAQHIVRLLTDSNAAESLSEKGHQFILRTFDWEKATEILENVITAERK